MKTIEIKSNPEKVKKIQTIIKLAHMVANHVEHDIDEAMQNGYQNPETGDYEEFKNRQEVIDMISNQYAEVQNNLGNTSGCFVDTIYHVEQNFKNIDSDEVGDLTKILEKSIVRKFHRLAS